jgi:serine protease Do
VSIALDQVLGAESSELAESLSRITVRVTDGRASCGSGILWDSARVITNAHVIPARAKQVQVEVGGRLETARLEKLDRRRDLAELRLAPGSPDGPLRKGSARSLRAGELVFALGHPLGLRNALASGIVHAVGPSEAMPHLDWIQADIRLAPGNSGGPLADSSGRVVGVNAMIAQGLGLAIPVESVERFLAGEPEHPEFGVTVQPVAVQMDRRRRVPGMYLEEVKEGSRAQAAGLRTGDILLGFDHPYSLLAKLRSADAVTLRVLREGREVEVLVVLRS